MILDSYPYYYKKYQHNRQTNKSKPEFTEQTVWTFVCVHGIFHLDDHHL